MNFYQELQLNQAGSKSYIASFKNPKDSVPVPFPALIFRQGSFGIFSLQFLRAYEKKSVKSQQTVVK